MRKSFSLALLVLLVTSPCLAQRLPITKGSFETAVAGRLDPDGAAGTEVALDLRFGAFVQSYNQVGVDVEWERFGDSSRSSLGMYALHLFETKTYLLPYMGVELGFGSAELEGGADDSGFELGVFSGLKYFLSNHVSLNTELSAAISSGDTFISEDKLDNVDLAFSLGLSFLW